MNIRSLIDGAIALAKMAAPLIPGLGSGVKIAEKIEGIFDDLHADAPPAKQAEMQEARKELAAAVTAHAKATSDRLRG